MSRRPAAVAVYGPKVRAARERAELSQAQLAERLGLNQTTISRWETTSVLLLTSVADRLAENLHTSRNALVDVRECEWCGLPQTSARNPLLRAGGDRWAHRAICFDALARESEAVS